VTLETLRLYGIAYFDPSMRYQMDCHTGMLFHRTKAEPKPVYWQRYLTNEVCRARRKISTMQPPKKGGRVFSNELEYRVAQAVERCRGIRPDTEGLDSRGDGSNGRSSTMRRQVLQRCSTGTSQG